MQRAPTPRVSTAIRILPIGIVTALLAVVLFSLSMPAASATPTAPYFDLAVQVDQLPAYTASNPSLAVGSDGVEYLAFAGWGGSTTQSDIFFTKSTNGRTWTVPYRVNDDVGGAAQTDPSLTLDRANNIYIAWTDTRLGTNDIFFSKSTNGGLSFSGNVRVNDFTGNSQSQADLAVDPVNSNLVHVVWTDARNAFLGPDIYYANSTDGGLSFNPSSRVNNDLTGAEQSQPAIAVAPNRDVYVVWRDPRNPARGPDIYFAKSSDLGATWSGNYYVNDDAGAATQQDPTIAVDAAGAIYVAWTDYRNPNTAPDIYAARSTNAGASFGANVKVNDDTGIASQSLPSLATGGGKIQVAWADSRTAGSTSWDIYTASSTDGLTWSPNMKVNDDALPNVFQWQPSIGIDASGDVFAAWLDTRLSGQDIFAGVLDVVSPIANAGPAITVDEGATVALDGSGSSDNLGIASYYWDFHDGTGATGVTTNRVYATPGTYVATLTVWDFSGNAASATKTITVRDTVPPVPRGAGDRTVDEGQPLFFDASASTDNVGVVSYAWNFGDNSTANTATASHVYANPGIYHASLTVTDGAGNSATAPFTVTVRTISPKPSDLLGMIQILEAIVAVLGIALVFLGWMFFARRSQERPTEMPMSARPPAQPPAPPRQEPDPLDMSLPPPPPKSP